MKKGLKVTLAAVAITLLCGAAFSYAPLIKEIPDIYIGDAEDNVGQTGDLNIFRFSDAINFDVFVYGDPNDEDYYTTGVRWSFEENPAHEGSLTINGIISLGDSDDPLTPGAKELTSYPNFSEPFDQVPDAEKPDEKGRASSWADFYDLKDSDPITGDPVNDPLDTFITVFASNGTKYSSKAVYVRALDGGEDHTSAVDGIEVEDIITWAAPVADAFTDFSMDDGTYVPASDGAFYVSNHVTSGNKIGIEGNSTAGRSVYGAWYSPAADTIAYAANSVYRVKYTIESTAAADEAPLCRLLSHIDQAGGTSVVNGGYRVGAGPFQPDSDGEVYSVYLDSGDLTGAGAVNFRTSFELIDFSDNEAGTNYVSEIQVQKFDAPSKDSGTSVFTYDGPAAFSGWTSQVMNDFITSFGDATVGSDSNGLYIETPEAHSATNISYAKWSGGGGDVTYEADKLYRAVFSLKAQNDTDYLGKVRLVVGNDGNNWQALYSLITDATDDHMPGTAGKEYSVWQESMPVLYTESADLFKNNMNYIFDVSDGNNAQGGRVYLEKLEIIYYDIP